MLLFQAEQVQERGVIVVMADGVRDGLVAKLVRFAVNRSALHASAGQPHAEPIGIVIAADVLLVFDDRQSPHLAAPMDERGVQQAALLEILHEGSRGLVGPATDGRQRLLDAAVMVPRLIAVCSWTNRTPRSTSRRAIRQRVPYSFVSGSSMPYSLWVAAVSAAMSKASLAALCIFAANS